MAFDIIEKLLEATPQKRRKLINRMRQKNIEYLKKYGQGLSEAVAAIGTGPYGVRIQKGFLDLVNKQNNQVILPSQGDKGILDYVTGLGAWHHSAWIDKIEMRSKKYPGQQHGRLLAQFVAALAEALPRQEERMAKGVVRLPALSDGRRYSGSCIFLGAFTGLHIAHYLNRTVVRDIAIIEPDMHNFALSCLFLDYQEIEQTFGRLLLHVGPNLPQRPIEQLIGNTPLTSMVWMRMLPGYSSPEFDDVVRRFNLRWRALSEIAIPFDFELRNVEYGLINLERKVPFLCRRPRLSDNSRIIVVGSGPSLDRDLDWLRENQRRLIVICATSTVRVLKRAGIQPDFQTNLNTQMTPERVAQLELDPDIPMIAYYKSDPKLIDFFRTPLLLHESGKANAVQIKLPFTYTHPTTGNLAVAVAAFARPRALYLAGFDVGFREAEKSHAAGTWHDDDQGRGHAAFQRWDQVRAPANFAEAEGEIYTNAYHNAARTAMEGAIQELAPKGSVFNLSDGARIEGAQAMRSGDIRLTDYPEKAADVAAIIGAFDRDFDRVLAPYPLSGEELVAEWKRGVLAALEFDRFDWRAFGAALDGLGKRVQAEVGAGGDVRLEVFNQLLRDLLASWYRALIFTETPAESEAVFRAGQTALRAALAEVVWPPAIAAGEAAFRVRCEPEEVAGDAGSALV